MRKRNVRPAVLALCSALFLSSGTMTAYAQHLDGASGWKVEFTSNKKMESNFTSSEIAEAVAGLQPGDDITFQVGLKNAYDAETEWYMSNEILYSLEDRSGTASGGAYTYELLYISGDATNVLFSSDTVGGEDPGPEGEGLHEATDALEDYIYLDTLSNGDGGRIELTVGLDGETQGNAYQDTLADLKLSFAVTPAPEPKRIPGRPWDPDDPGYPSDPENPNGPEYPTDEEIPDEPVPGDPWIVKTGDYRDFTMPAVIMICSGMGFLILAVLSFKDRKKAYKGGRV